jgi:hypothetical protein
MKKSFLFLFSLLINSVYSVPVGNPSEASMFYPYCSERCCEDDCWGFLSVGAGFYGDYVFNRYMKTTHNTPRNKNIDRTQIFTNAGYIVLNFWGLIDFFSSLGVSRLSLNTSLGAFNPTDTSPLFEVESGSDFSYSVGGRITLLEHECASLGFEGQYFETKPNIKRMYIASGAVVYPDDTLRTRYSEWQVGAGISYRYNEFFIPYIAAKYAHSHWKFGNGENFIIEDNTGTFLFNMRNRKNWGYVVGLTLIPPVCEQAAVTAEARFAGEKALYINAQARF